MNFFAKRISLAFTCIGIITALSSICPRSLALPTTAALANSRQPFWMKVILKDGSQMYIDPGKVQLSVKTEFGKFKLALGSLRAVKFISSPDNPKPNEVIVRFQSGLIKRMQLASHDSNFTTVTTDKKKIKVYYKDIMGILGPTFFDNGEPANTATNDNLWRYIVTLNDGSSEQLFIPVDVLKAKTDIGSIYLPTPMIHSITRKAESGSKYEISTIYGELITGSISGGHLKAIAQNDRGYKYISFRDVKKMEMMSSIIPIPPKWITWYIKPGLAISACFYNQTTGLITENGEPIPADSVKSVIKTIDGTFCTTRSETLIRCHQTERYIDIVPLSSGRKIRVPWSKVCALKTQTKITAKDLVCLMVDDSKNVGNNEKRRGYIPNTTDKKGDLKIKSAGGSFKIAPDSIVSISIDQKASRAAIKTVFGDTLLTPIPSRDWLAAFVGQDEFEFPDENKPFTIKSNRPTRQAITTNDVVCRMISGDIIHGKLPKQDLSILRHNKSSREVDIKSLKMISRDADGNFYFELPQGEIKGTPKQRTLKFVLAVSGATNEVPYKLIDTVVTGSTRISPPSRFRPGMPAELKNEVFIPGGSYMQGSMEGMDDEMPIHKVYLNAFFMDATEVTRSQFGEFISDADYQTSAEKVGRKQYWKKPGFEQGHTDPVVLVSWFDAARYCNWRSKKCGLTPCYTFNKDKTVDTDRTADGYRLPTEAEWEYASRSLGSNTTYACQYDNKHNLLANSKGITEADPWIWSNPTEYFPPNRLGLYGMSGNVWEWCEDWYFSQAYLQHRQSHNPCITHLSAPNLTRRVMRGGSFRNSTDMLRCTSRGNGIPFAFAPHVGFRCVRNAE